MRFVPVKSEAQSDVQALHRARLVAERTAQIKHRRALLLERGIVVPQGRWKLEDALADFADKVAGALSSRMRLLVEDLRAEGRELDTHRPLALSGYLQTPYPEGQLHHTTTYCDFVP